MTDTSDCTEFNHRLLLIHALRDHAQLHEQQSLCSAIPRSAYSELRRTKPPGSPAPRPATLSPGSQLSEALTVVDGAAVGERLALVVCSHSLRLYNARRRLLRDDAAFEKRSRDPVPDDA
jgi:hypothetical protein